MIAFTEPKMDGMKYAIFVSDSPQMEWNARENVWSTGLCCNHEANSHRNIVSEGK